ncbi:hypothetical protein F5887DRAFT_934084 [Amanita rubescens]|nr:hypothetical protein F5887DRAFT_934084 [Amanita rubescens]
MGRWAQYDEDQCRLPEDLVRIAYDADSRQYTFRDTSSGQLYRSDPGNSYGTLSPVSDRLDSRPNAFAPTHDHSRSQSVQNPFVTFHDILPSHAIATSPTKATPPSAFGSRFRSSAPNHQRSLSAHVPSSSQTTNALHMRSKSVRNESVRSRDKHGTHSRPRDTQRQGRNQHDVHSHSRDTQHQGHNQHDIHSHPRDTQHQGYNKHDKHTHPRDTQHVQGDVTSSRKNASKSGFSFSSALQSISRSLTSVCNRTRKANHSRRHSDSDANNSYLYL